MSEQHICTCEDCHPEPFADRCRFEAQVAQLKAENERAWQRAALWKQRAYRAGYGRDNFTTTVEGAEAYERLHGGHP